MCIISPSYPLTPDWLIGLNKTSDWSRWISLAPAGAVSHYSFCEHQNNNKLTKHQHFRSPYSIQGTCRNIDVLQNVPIQILKSHQKFGKKMFPKLTLILQIIIRDIESMEIWNLQEIRKYKSSLFSINLGYIAHSHTQLFILLFR